MKHSLITFALPLLLLGTAHGVTTLNVSLTANGTSRWSEHFSDAYGQVNKDPGLYSISTNMPYSTTADVFPSGADWANAGSFLLSGDVTGVGVENFTITGASFNISPFMANDDALVGGYTTGISGITGTASYTNGTLTSLVYNSAITFTYDFSAFGVGPLPFIGTLALTTNSFVLDVDQAYTFLSPNDLRYEWDASGGATYAVPEPSRALLCIVGLAIIGMRRRRRN